MAAGFKVAQGYLEVDVDYATLDAGIAGIEARLAAIRNLAIDANLPTGAIDAAIADITAKLATLKLKTLAIGGIDQTELNASLLEIQAKLTAFTDTHGLDIRTTGISDAISQLAALRVAADATTGTEGSGTGGGTGFLGLAAALLGFGGVRGALGALTAQIPLFGGALAGVPFLTSVGGFHLLADSILEVGAELIPAAIALGAFGVAASSTVSDIVHQEQAFLTITTALGTQFPGLSKGLQTFTDSVKPEVYVLFGEALGVINSHTSTFQQLATGAGQVLDNLGARAALALGGNGLDGLIGKGVSDLQTLGNIVGNVFGIFGNILKTLPGYAQLLFAGLQDATGALEALTGNSLVQGLLSIGLALHGAVLWGGLAVTGLMLLQTPIMSIVGWVGGAINALVKFGVMFSVVAAQEGILAAATATLEGVMAALAAVNPFVWVAIGVGALIGLVFWLSNTKTSAQQSMDAINKLAESATSFPLVMMALTNGLQQTNQQLQQTPQYIQVTTVGMHGLSQTITELNPQYTGLAGNVKALSGEISTQSSRLDQLNKITGSAATTQQDLQSIGVKNLDLATMSASAYKILVEEVTAYATATTQLAGYQSGPAAAAQNALTNLYMQETVPAIQKITQAETQLMTVITGGQSAFDSFELNLAAMNTNLSAAEAATGSVTHSFDGVTSKVSAAGAAMAGTSQASYTLNQAFYGQVNAAQQVVDALAAQSISTSDMSKVVATTVGQMLQFAGSNTAARSTLVDLINNALGPGTVTLKSLNQWVGTNSTSLGTMNGIIGDSTVKAGGLNGVLSTTLKNMQAIALLQAEGGQQAWNIFTSDIEKGTTNSQGFTTATQEVIAQLVTQSNNSLPAAQRAFENYAEQGLGLTKTQADALWKTDLPGMQAEIDSLHGASLGVNVAGSGSGTITMTEQGIKNAQTGYLEFHASGGPIRGFGGPTQDNVPVLASVGEYMVNAAAVNKYGVGLFEALNAQKLALGGSIDYSSFQNAVTMASGAETSAATSTEGSAAQAMIADMKAKIQAQAAAAAAAALTAASSFIASGGTSGGIIQAMMTTMAAARGWTGAQLTALLEVESREAGFSMTAQNPTSSAYGLAQFINGPSEYAQYGGNSTTAAGQITAMLNYIAQTYGTPEAAWQSELTRGFYGAGGYLPPGRSGYVGESGMERITAVPGGGTRVTPMGGGDLGSRLDTLINLTQTLINTTAAVPNGIGSRVGNAMMVGGASTSAQMRYGRRGT
jgi:hypothetical protein